MCVTLSDMAKSERVATVSVSLRIEEPLLGRLDALAGRLPFDPTRSQLVNTAIREMCDKYEAKLDGPGTVTAPQSPPEPPAKPKRGK